MNAAVCTVSQPNNVTKNDSLFATVEDGKLTALKTYEGDLNLLEDRDLNGETYLHRALYKCKRKQSYNSSKDMIHFILSEAPQLTDIKNNNGETPLCLACKLNVYHEAITLLIETNPNCVTIADGKGKTPMHHILEIKEESSCTDQHESDTNGFNSNTSTQRQEIVELLFTNGANINKEDIDGLSAMHFILYSNSSESKGIDENMLEFLLKNGGKFSLLTDIIQALIESKTLNVVKLIVENHASSINNTDEKGWTPFHHVIESYSKDKDDIIEYLIENGVIVEEGANLLNLLGKKHCEFHLIEKILNKYPEFINVKIGYDGTTSLIRYSGDAEIVEKLLFRGADVSIVNYIGDHALLHAVKSRNKKAINAAKKLLEAGSDPLLLNKDKKDLLFLIFCNLKKFAGFVYDESLESVEHNYVQDFDEWYKLFKWVLQLQPYKNPILHRNLSFIFFRLIDTLADAHTRSLRLVKPLEMLNLLLDTNCNIYYIVSERSVRSFSNPLMCIRFKDSVVEPITSLLLNQSYTYLYGTLVEFIHAMLDAGFPVSQTPIDSVTPLTALLIKKYQTVNLRDIESREHVLKLTEEFIIRKVNVGSMALKIKDNFEVVQYLKNQFWLPDALFLAFLNNETEIVEMLLPHWWAPPLALMIFKIPVIDENIDLFVSWYTLLSKYGRIPHGTKIHTSIKNHINNWFEELEFAYPVNHDPEYSKWRPIWEEFNHQQRNPLTLVELGKYAVRQSLARRASYPDTSLPTLLQEAVAPTLHFLVMH